MGTTLDIGAGPVCSSFGGPTPMWRVSTSGGGYPSRSPSADTPAPSPLLSPRAETRPCSRCGELREAEDFARDRTRASGHKNHCKECDRAKARAYYVANRERVIARVSKTNRERRNAKRRDA